MTGYRKGPGGQPSGSTKNENKDISAYDRWEVPAIAEEKTGQENQINNGVGYRIDRFKPPTVHDLEEVRKKAYEEGFKEGKDKGFIAGHDLGVRKGEEEKKSETALIAQVARALMEPINQQDQALEKVMLSLVIQISKLILKRELYIDSSQVMQIVREALATLSCGSKTIKILLHPADLANILPEIKKLPDYQESWRIVERAGLSPGGCIVESNEGLVDATVDRRVEQIVNQVYAEKMPQNLDEEDEVAQTEPKSEFLEDEDSQSDEPH